MNASFSRRPFHGALMKVNPSTPWTTGDGSDIWHIFRLKK